MNIKFFTTKNFKGMTANVLLSAGIILLILFFAKDNVPELISTGFDKFYLVEDSGVTFYCFDSVSVCYLLLAFVFSFVCDIHGNKAQNKQVTIVIAILVKFEKSNS